MMLADHHSTQESDLQTKRARSGMFTATTVVSCLSRTDGSSALCSGPFKISELSNDMEDVQIDGLNFVFVNDLNVLHKQYRSHSADFLPHTTIPTRKYGIPSALP